MPKHAKSPKKGKSNAATRHSQRADAGYGECPHCGQVFRKRGLGRHQDSCAATIQPEDPELDTLLMGPINSEQGDDIDIPGQDQPNANDDIEPENQSEPLEDDHDVNMQAPTGSQSGQASSGSISEIRQAEATALSRDDLGQDQVPDVENPLLIPATYVFDPFNDIEPEVDEICVEYHPTTGKDPQHFSFYDYDITTPSDSSGTSSQSSDQVDTEPWRPFSSRLDFEVADLILATHMSKDQTDALLSLIKQCIATPEVFTLSDSTELSKTWKAARSKSIAVPYPKPNSLSSVKFNLWSQPLWEWCNQLLSDPKIVSRFQWNAERVFKFNSTRKTFERVIRDPWTADAWWEVQSRIPQGGHPFCIILYADKTQLSLFGTAKAYPVLARCANLPVELRNGKGLSGGRLVGWLPIVQEDAKESGKKNFVNLKRIVWHESFKVILESIMEYAKTGMWKDCADGIRRWLFPIILILSADYEEQK